MSRACELTGKAVLTGNNVSHANNKTRRRFLPNLVQVTLISEALGQSYRLRISAAALRSVEHRGGLDAFLMKAASNDLSQRARVLKKQIAKKMAEQAALSLFATARQVLAPAGSRSLRCRVRPASWWHHPG